jgi:hypothetical protein
MSGATPNPESRGGCGVLRLGSVRVRKIVSYELRLAFEARNTRSERLKVVENAIY